MDDDRSLWSERSSLVAAIHREHDDEFDDRGRSDDEVGPDRDLWWPAVHEPRIHGDGAWDRGEDVGDPDAVDLRPRSGGRAEIEIRTG